MSIKPTSTFNILNYFYDHVKLECVYTDLLTHIHTYVCIKPQRTGNVIVGNSSSGSGRVKHHQEQQQQH